MPHTKRSKHAKTRKAQPILSVLSYKGTYVGLAILFISMVALSYFCYLCTTFEGVGFIYMLCIAPAMFILNGYLFKILCRIILKNKFRGAWEATKICSPYVIALILIIIILNNTHLDSSQSLLYSFICYVLSVNVSLVLMYIEIMQTFFWKNLNKQK